MTARSSKICGNTAEIAAQVRDFPFSHRKPLTAERPFYFRHSLLYGKVCEGTTMPTAIVTSKGQITIPKAVRDALGVEAGDRVEFVEREKGVYTVVAATRDIRDLKGLVPPPPSPVSVEDMKRAVRRRAARQ
jgi:AbrB family looped-hinge helix DNA binding protein